MSARPGVRTAVCAAIAGAWALALPSGCAHRPAPDASGDVPAASSNDPPASSKQLDGDGEGSDLGEFSHAGDGLFLTARAADDSAAWQPVLSQSAADLTQCFRDFSASVLACRESQGMLSARVYVTYQVSPRDGPPSKFEREAHPHLLVFPLSASSDECADDYELAGEFSGCLLAALDKHTAAFPSVSVSFTFRNFEGSEGEVGLERLREATSAQ